jgi:hypothetical protein
MAIFRRIMVVTVVCCVLVQGCGGDNASQPAPVVDIVEPDVPPTYDTAVDIKLPNDAPPAQDTTPADTKPPPEPDTIESDTAPPAPDTAPPKSVMSATIDEPTPDQVFEKGTSLTFNGVVSDSIFAPSMLTVEWASNKDGVLDTAAAAADGAVSFSTDALTPGLHLITLTVTNPNDQYYIAGVEVSVCQWAFPDKFDTNITGGKWKTYGDAYWDPGGWLEMTGNLKGKKGAIFNTVDYLTPGDVTLSFKIQTGPNAGNGADGFALSVFRAKDLPELESWIAAAKAGGGLGYGISGNYGPVVVEAFHVEIDTWHNVYDGGGNLHTDPTEANHIAITLNGDPGNHVLWAEVPNIEDMQWHDVTVEVEGDHVKVTLDGNSIIDDTVPQFVFRGGYIGFTGTTGLSTNYHRFDDLQILQECLVP